MVKNDNIFPQMILDARIQNTLQWKSASMIIDETILTENSELIESVIQDINIESVKPISLYLYRIDDQLRSQRKRQSIRDILWPFRTNPSEPHQFMIFSKFYDDIIEVAESMDMFHVNNQWLFFILEKYRRNFDEMLVTQNLKEGANIAFVFNNTIPSCENSLNCTIEEITMAFVLSISQLIAEEQAIYAEISDEEWQSLHYTKQEKQKEILFYMRVSR